MNHRTLVSLEAIHERLKKLEQSSFLGAPVNEEDKSIMENIIFEICSSKHCTSFGSSLGYAFDGYWCNFTDEDKKFFFQIFVEKAGGGSEYQLSISKKLYSDRSKQLYESKYTYVTIEDLKAHLKSEVEKAF